MLIGSTRSIDGCGCDNRVIVTVTIPAKTGYLTLRNGVISGYLSLGLLLHYALNGCISTERLHICNRLGQPSIL